MIPPLTALTAHRWRATTTGVVVLGVLGYLTRADVVPLPFLDKDVPVRILIGLAVVTVTLVPLYETFPVLSRTFPREPVVRPLRVVAAVLLAVGGYAPAAAGPAGAGPAGLEAWQQQADATLVAVLLVVGLLAVAALGEHAWAVVLGGGFAVLFLDTAPSAPASRLLIQVPWWTIGCGLLAAMAVLAWRGPRATGVT